MELNFTLKIFSHTWKISIEKQWTQFGIAITAVLLAVIISYWGTFSILLIIPALVIGVFILLALLRHPNIGFIFLLLAGMFVPFYGPGGMNAAIVMAAGMVGLWLLDMIIVKKELAFVKSRILLPITVFLLITIISFVMGQIPWFVFANQAPLTAQFGGFFIFVLSMGVTLAAAHLIKDIRWLQAIVWIFLGLGSIYIIGKVANLSFIGRFFQAGALGSMFWTWLVALAFSQLIFNNTLKPRLKILLAIFNLLVMYVAVGMGYDWKSGWLPAIVAILTILAIRFRKITLFMIPYVLIVAFYFAYPLIASEDYSWGTRIDAWTIVLRISDTSPLLGLGFANYYWYTPLFPIRGYSVTFNSHSQFVDLIAQTGYFGFLSFFWVFFSIARLSWSLSRKLSIGFARAYAYGTLAGTVATLIAAYLGDWILPFVYNVGMNGFRASILVWLFFGGLIAIEQIYSKSLDAPRN